MTTVKKKYHLLLKKLTTKIRKSLPDPGSVSALTSTEQAELERRIVDALVSRDAFANYQVLKLRSETTGIFPEAHECYKNYLSDDVLVTTGVHRVSNTQLFFVFSVDVQDKKLPFLGAGSANMKPGLLYGMAEINTDSEGNKYLILSFPKFQQYRYKEYFFDNERQSIIATIEDMLRLNAERIELKAIYQDVGSLKRKGFSVKNFRTNSNASATPISLGFFADGKFSDLETFQAPLDEIFKSIVDGIELAALEKSPENQDVKEKIAQFVNRRAINGADIFNELHMYFVNGRGQLIYEDSSSRSIRYWLFYDADLVKCKYQGWEAFKPFWGALCKSLR